MYDPLHGEVPATPDNVARLVGASQSARDSVDFRCRGAADDRVYKAVRWSTYDDATWRLTSYAARPTATVAADAVRAAAGGFPGDE